MTTTRCVHGLDSRFCAICNRIRPAVKPPAKARATTTRGTSRTKAAPAPAPSFTPGVSLGEILGFLNEAKTRATYGAVAALLGVPAVSLGAALGARRPEASWVVNAETGLPTDYEQSEWHPDLLVSSTIISSGTELGLRLAARPRSH